MGYGKRHTGRSTPYENNRGQIRRKSEGQGDLHDQAQEEFVWLKHRYATKRYDCRQETPMLAG
jgi:hypothetical protein